VVERYLRETVQSLPSANFENRFVKAFIFGTIKERLLAEEMFEQLVLESSFLPKIYLAWGDTYLFSDNPLKAIAKFKQARALLPDLNNIYLNETQGNKLKQYYSLIDGRLQSANKLLNK